MLETIFPWGGMEAAPPSPNGMPKPLQEPLQRIRPKGIWAALRGREKSFGLGMEEGVFIGTWEAHGDVVDWLVGG